MVHTLTEPGAAPVGSPVRPRGILAVASPAPDGWERGGISFSVACPDPVVVDKCITLTPQVPSRPTLAEFSAFVVEQGVDCSTLSGGDRSTEASDALNASTDYALGLTLLNGAANTAAADGLTLNSATAISATEYANAMAAVAALECAATLAGAGSEYTLHATISSAAYLRSLNLIDDDGRSPAGAQWIVSSGYGCVEGELRIWATGRVVAAAGQIVVNEAINRRTNNREAWASRALIVGFNPCVNLTATFAASGGDTPAVQGYTAGYRAEYT